MADWQEDPSGRFATEWQDRASEPPSYAAVNQRLASIDRSIAEIRGLLERMVLVEERVRAMTLHLARLETHLSATDSRVVNVEVSASRSGLVVGGMERIWWLAVAAAAVWIGQRI